MKRVFTDDEKSLLLQYVKETDEQNGFLDFFDDLFTVGVSIDDYSSIDAFHREMIDDDNISASEIEKIYSDVVTVDGNYSAKAGSLYRDMHSLESELRGLKSLLFVNNLNSSGTPLFKTPDEFAKNLSTVCSDLWNDCKNRMINADGSVNWDEVQKTLSQDEAFITPAEYAFLVDLYLSLDKDEDIAKFLACFASPNSNTYNSWSVDSDKLDKFQATLGSLASSIENINYLIGLMSDEEIAALFDGRSRNSIIGDYSVARDEILSKFFLLDAYKMHLGKYQGTLARGGGSFPDVTVVTDSSGNRSVTFYSDECTIVSATFYAGPVVYQEANHGLDVSKLSGSYRVNINYYPSNPYSYTVSKPSNEGLEEAVANNAKMYFVGSGDFLKQTLKDDTISAVLGQADSFVYDTLTEGAKGVLKYGAGAFGFVAGIASDVVSDLNDKYQMEADVNNFTDAISFASYCDRMGFVGSVISNGSSKQNIVYYPSRYTYSAVSTINKFLSDPNEGVDVTDYGFENGHIITVDDVMNHPDQIARIIDDMDAAGWEMFIQ